MFISGLVKLLKDKNCTFEYDGSKSTIKKEPASEIIKEEILNTKDITNDEYQKILELQNKGYSTQEDKLKIEKHIYKLKWDIDEINKDNIDVIYSSTSKMENLKVLLDKYDSDFKLDEDDVKPDKIVREQFKKEQKIKVVIDFLKCFRYRKINQ